LKTAIIVGSGPSGISASYALITRGYAVTMLDIGNCDPNNSHSKNKFITNESRNELLKIKEFKWTSKNNTNDLASKGAAFKENFFYANSDRIISQKKNAVINISYAQGGLSNLWGGACLPVSRDDIKDWELRYDELYPYYEKLTSFFKISASNTNLDLIFNSHSGLDYQFPIGKQAKIFLDHLTQNQNTLNQKNFYFGRARLAIDPAEKSTHPNFPYGPIFNSGTEVEKLKNNPNFKYIPNQAVLKLVEEKNAVIIHSENTISYEKTEFHTSKVYLACGPLNTSMIILKSLSKENVALTFKTNQNAFFPFLMFKRSCGISKEKENNLIQLFLELKTKVTGNHLCHLQVYEYGEYVLEPIYRIIGRLIKIFKFLTKPFLERTLILQCLLHSDYSDELILKIDSTNTNWKWKVEGSNNKLMKKTFSSVRLKLLSHFKELGGFIFPYIFFVDPPGASNHIGCCFPMKKAPRHDANESDLLGRPFGLKNIHIVDSSVLPSLPATTVTYTIMANAYRIVDRSIE
jgi:hypothetical protein